METKFASFQKSLWTKLNENNFLEIGKLCSSFRREKKLFLNRQKFPIRHPLCVGKFPSGVP
jgi:hypothetical protein